MLPFKLIYHERYDLNLGAHVFPSQKFQLIESKLLQAMESPDPRIFCGQNQRSMRICLRVHTGEWVSKLKTGTLTLSDVMKLEVPYSRGVGECVLACGGRNRFWLRNARCRMDLAATSAADFITRIPNHGEGFCAIHDVAVAIRRLQADGAIRKAMVVDTDVHHGNGTAAIFAKDDSVFTLSIHQLNNYPAYKPSLEC